MLSNYLLMKGIMYYNFDSKKWREKTQIAADTLDSD